jgi:hypothetical protein
LVKTKKHRTGGENAGRTLPVNHPSARGIQTTWNWLWGGFVGALLALWGGFRVALGWLCSGFVVALESQSVGYQQALGWLVGGFGFAIGS